MKKTQLVEIELTPEEVAEIWWKEWGNEAQVRFLNHIGKMIHEEGMGGNEVYQFLMQLQYITDTPELTKYGRYVMQLMGEYASKEPRQAL